MTLYFLRKGYACRWGRGRNRFAGFPEKDIQQEKGFSPAISI